MKIALVLACLALTTQAVPQRRRQQFLRQAQPVAEVQEEEFQKPKVYEVQREISPNVGDGSFRYLSVMSDGHQSEQVGHFSNPLESQVHQGSYTTTDEHGQVVRVDYIADKNGFRPIGANGAPVLPTAPPVPEELIRARESILQQQKEIREQHLGYLRAGYIAHGR